MIFSAKKDLLTSDEILEVTGMEYFYNVKEEEK